ncbi:MAG: hypothetical protein AAGD92_13950 [Pseudomonadota bacterium]
MTDALKFCVMGENDEIYDVSITRHAENSANLTALCNCDKDRAGDFCSHRFEILEGDTSNLVSKNLDDMQILRGWIRGSDVEAAMNDLSRAKSDLKIARERYAYCRNVLAKRMMD